MHIKILIFLLLVNGCILSQTDLEEFGYSGKPKKIVSVKQSAIYKNGEWVTTDSLYICSIQIFNKLGNLDTLISRSKMLIHKDTVVTLRIYKHNKGLKSGWTEYRDAKKAVLKGETSRLHDTLYTETLTDSLGKVESYSVVHLNKNYNSYKIETTSYFKNEALPGTTTYLIRPGKGPASKVIVQGANIPRSETNFTVLLKDAIGNPLKTLVEKDGYIMLNTRSYTYY